MDEGAREVLLGAKDSGAAHRALPHFSRVGAKELRAGCHRAAVNDRPVLRDMVALVAPAPGTTFRGLTEEREVVQPRVAECPP